MFKFNSGTATEPLGYSLGALGYRRTTVFNFSTHGHIFSIDFIFLFNLH